MKECFKEKKFRSESLKTIEMANNIIEAYKQQGYNLTLRQLYYQFVAQDLIPNTEKSYKNLGSIINNGRLSGLIDWKAIEDRTRNLRKLSHWDNPADIVSACVDQFRVDKWSGQRSYCEVWIEKDALVGVIEKVCKTWDVPHFSCRGYVSQSEMYDAAKRFIDKEVDIDREECILFHLGDHDPSGIDMTRDIKERLELFGANVHVCRIALSMDQIEEFTPPPNPAKVTDSRFESYKVLYGDESWELDSMPPNVISSVIENHILNVLDVDKWAELVKVEESYKNSLREYSYNWSSDE